MLSAAQKPPQPRRGDVSERYPDTPLRLFLPSWGACSSLRTRMVLVLRFGSDLRVGDALSSFPNHRGGRAGTCLSGPGFLCGIGGAR